MSIEEYKAAKVTAPTGNGVDNSDVRYVAVSTTATSIAIPAAWHRGWVTLKLVTANAVLFFSEQVTTLPDISKVAADPQLGWYMAAGEKEDYRLPGVTPGATLYLCIDGDATGSLYLRPSSEPGV